MSDPSTQIDVLAARRALDAVTHSVVARASFVAAYDGPGEAVGVLRQFLARVEDPAGREADRLRRENLERAAFARADSPREAKRAEQALAVFRAEDQVRTAQLTGLVKALAALTRADHGPSR
ncbi:hypothetical protein [Herbiconiux ginsengi]|uniref:Uncharacterized protein n=1 Tax=Herbiconiux ginsengi TaxID=381665 RepID=A0A1H3MJ73_9MICO|nr:hypothetical protein [Herbiconiux ginsengi]SDY76752.1 hypothetical protein SAMN05216554_1449 [Herbiconiux ginsengi]